MTITYKELAEKAEISLPYACQLLNEDWTKRRKPSLSLALRIYDRTGLQLGPITGLAAEDIEPLRKVAA